MVFYYCNYVYTKRDFQKHSADYFKIAVETTYISAKYSVYSA